MPFFLDRSHYVEIVTLLTAGDVAAKVIDEGAVDGRKRFAVQVTLAEAAGTMTWRNTTPYWTCVLVQATGDGLVAQSHIGWQAVAEVVAEAIATWDPL